MNSNNESPNKRQRRDDFLWIPDDVKFCSGGPVQVKLLCGADLLESFGIPGLWKDDDVSTYHYLKYLHFFLGFPSIKLF